MNRLIQFFKQNKSPLVYIKVIITFIILLVGFHGTIWNLYTKELLRPSYPFYAGDLSRISYQASSLHLRKVKDITLSKKHINMYNYKGEPATIITIGDSFSDGGAKGKNAFYQDYISSKYDINILNILPKDTDTDFIKIIITLLENNLLHEMKTKVIILESIERYAIKRFSSDINWNNFESKKEFFQRFKNPIKKQYKESGITFINNGNYKYISNTLLYNLSTSPYLYKHIYQADLEIPLFTVRADDSLLFYYEDVKNIPNSTQANLERLNLNLNYLAKRLNEHDIRLVFMPVVDKYNLYYPYIKDNNLPKSKFFELLEPLEKEYYFVNTKILLRDLLPQTKDLYYADDTHWNYTASQHIIQSIPFKELLQE